jgi:hypothetical protein
MSEREHPSAHRRITPFHAGVCFFLAALFFYNPFLTIYGSSPVLKVQHPPSFRATVASSELQLSRVSQVQPKVYVPQPAILEAVAPAAAPGINAGAPLEVPLGFQPQIFPESLWFRPPPVS